MFHDESWKPIYFGGQKVKGQGHETKDSAGVGLCSLVTDVFSRLVRCFIKCYDLYVNHFFPLFYCFITRIATAFCQCSTRYVPIMWNAHNIVFGSKRSSICAQAVYFLHSTMPSVTCLRLSDVSVICCVTYFQFPIQVCFSYMSVSQSAQRRTSFTQYQTSDAAEHLGRFLARSVQLRGNDFELILTVKMETRHPAEGLFGSELRAICNHCGLMTACSIVRNICFFFAKTTHYGKIFKIQFRKFLSRHLSTLLCLNF